MGCRPSKKRAGGGEEWENPSQKKMDKALKKAIDTKLERIPQLNRNKVWSEEEITALANPTEWKTLEAANDAHGITFTYPNTWELIPPLQVSPNRYERVVRTGHPMRRDHMRSSAEVGFSVVDLKKTWNEDDLFRNFVSKIVVGAKANGGVVEVDEILPDFKGGRAYHSVSFFKQPDGTTSRVEMYHMLRKKRDFIQLVLFNADVSCWDTYKDMMEEIRDSASYRYL